MQDFSTADGFDLDPQIVGNKGGDEQHAPMSTPTIILTSRIAWTIASILTTNACGSSPTTGRC